MERQVPKAGLVAEEMQGAVATDTNPIPSDCSFTPAVSKACDQTRCWLHTALLMVLVLCYVVPMKLC